MLWGMYFAKNFLSVKASHATCRNTHLDTFYTQLQRRVSILSCHWPFLKCQRENQISNNTVQICLLEKSKSKPSVEGDCSRLTFCQTDAENWSPQQPTARGEERLLCHCNTAWWRSHATCCLSSSDRIKIGERIVVFKTFILENSPVWREMLRRRVQPAASHTHTSTYTGSRTQYANTPKAQINILKISRAPGETRGLPTHRIKKLISVYTVPCKLSYCFSGYKTSESKGLQGRGITRFFSMLR